MQAAALHLGLLRTANLVLSRGSEEFVHRGSKRKLPYVTRHFWIPAKAHRSSTRPARFGRGCEANPTAAALITSLKPRLTRCCCGEALPP